MSKNSIGTDTRQSVSLFVDSLADVSPDGVARRGQPPTTDDNPRTVTRGYLLQSSSLYSCDINPGVVVDWVSFTLPIASADNASGIVHELRQLFGGGEVLDRGFHGYTMCVSILGGTGQILWHPGRVEMGVHVNLPASALHNMNQDGILDDVRDFLGWILYREGKFARLDIAIDTDSIFIDRIVEAVDGDELVSRCQWAKEERMLRGAAGRTVYVGAPTSDRRVRFYDKAAEQKLNEDLPEGAEPFVWTRAEIQHRDRHAQVAAQSIVDGDLDPVALFNSVLDFRDPESDVNPSRRVRCDWWAAWLGSLTDRVSFAFARPDKPVKQVAEWVTRQVSTSLAMLAMADPDNIRNWLLSTIDDGFGRLDPFRRSKAARFRDLGLTLA